MQKQQKTEAFASVFTCGAGDGNRTHAASLEGWNSTIELHSHLRALRKYWNIISQTALFVKRKTKKTFSFLPINFSRLFGSLAWKICAKGIVKFQKICYNIK